MRGCDRAEVQIMLLSGKNHAKKKESGHSCFINQERNGWLFLLGHARNSRTISDSSSNGRKDEFMREMRANKIWTKFCGMRISSGAAHFEFPLILPDILYMIYTHVNVPSPPARIMRTSSKWYETSFPEFDEFSIRLHGSLVCFAGCE